MRCIDEIPAGELKGKRVLLRAGLDLSLTNSGEIADFFRVEKARATIEYLIKSGARTIILNHIGRDPENSNDVVARGLKHYVPAVFIPDLVGNVAHNAVGSMKDGDVAVLENLRRDPRELKDDETFASELAALGDLYVDDAFSAVHRAHASIVGVPKLLPNYAGILLCEEVKNLESALMPQSPSLAILGGAKFETKAPLVKLLLQKYDHVFITGALANDVFKAHGLPVGRSLLSKELPSLEILAHPHFLAPLDVTVENGGGQAMTKKPQAVEQDEKIVDIGPDTVAMLAPIIANAKFILWNGPTGIYEKGYNAYTKQIAELAAKSEAKIVVGGGDTVAAIEHAGVKMGERTFLSTGGGAMMEYLLKGTLPGIEALK